MVINLTRLWPIILLFVISIIFESNSIEYHVSPNGSDLNSGSLSSPFKSIVGARNTIRTINNEVSENITVYIHGGRYELSKKINFDSLDGGKNGYRIIYKAYENETPIISGGKVIDKWIFVGNGIYKASTKGLGSFRQLYINGKRAIRARNPNDKQCFKIINWDKSNQKIQINSSDILLWPDNFSEVVVYYKWTQMRLRISSISKNGSTATIYIKDGMPSHPKYDNIYYFFENGYKFLDSPGEWFLDKKNQIVYYKARENEDMNSAEVIVPVVETLLEINGADNLTFNGLIFEHTNWIAPDNEEFANRQGAINYTSSFGNGISCLFSDSLQFTNNIFRHMGAHSLVFFRGISNSLIEGNIFTDISADGIVIDKYLTPYDSQKEYSSADDDSYCRYNKIKNNFVYNVACDYYGSVGIFVGYAHHTLIEHNEVAYLPYTGISIGWGWYPGTVAGFSDNIIRANNIHHVMKELTDGGGIYTLGSQPNSIITNNYIHDIVLSPIAKENDIWDFMSIYLDQGTCWFTVKNNVMNNIIRGIWEHNISRNPTKNNTISNNNYSLEIISNAGLESRYKYLLQYMYKSENQKFCKIKVNRYFVLPGNKVQCNAVALDQYDNPLVSQPVFSWNITGNGNSTISKDGYFIADSSINSSYILTVNTNYNGVKKSAETTIEVTDAKLINGYFSVIGQGIPFGGANNAYARALDGYTETYADCDGKDIWVGYDFGNEKKTITQIRYWPRDNWSERMKNRTFEISDDGEIWKTIYTIKETPREGCFTTVRIDNPQSAKFIRYNGSGGYLNVSEIEFYEKLTSGNKRILLSNKLQDRFFSNAIINNKYIILNVNSNKEYSVKIFDLNGKTILDKQRNISERILINKNVFSSGCYFIQISSNYRKRVVKLIIR